MEEEWLMKDKEEGRKTYRDSIMKFPLGKMVFLMLADHNFFSFLL